MGTAAPIQQIKSSYTWGGLFDFVRRRGANAGSIPAADQLTIIKAVSSYAYTRYMWPFTLATTQLGQIQAVNGQQDYPQPPDCFRVSRAWFYVPTQTLLTNDSYGPYDDPSLLASMTVAASVAYVNAQSANGGGLVAGLTYPASGTLNVVKRLPQNLLMASYTGIRAICQQPNQNLLRLDWATSVSSNQPYSLELEYQISRPVVNAPTETCWFPDDYVAIAEEGILYYLYKYTADPRTGGVTMSGSNIEYSGQYAAWQAALESAAAADREGSVDQITPTSSLGADTTWTGWPFA